MLEVGVQKQLGTTAIELEFRSPAVKTVVFGPSGCGKTTLLKMLAGLTVPDAGFLRCNGTTVVALEDNMVVPAHRRGFGYLPQKSCLFPHMDVAQNIAYPLRRKGRAAVSAALETWGERLGIAHLMQRYPAQLSGGQQQRVALARVFASNPRLLLLDEPFSALDNAVREELRDLLIALVDELQLPTLLVTHDREEAYVFGEYMVVMCAGQIVETGPLQQIFHAPAYIESAQMLGYDNQWKIDKTEGDTVVLTNGWRLTCATRLPAGASHVCIRPEDVMILRPDRPVRDALRNNVLSVTVAEVYPRGRHYKLLVTTPDAQTLSINIPEHAFKVMELRRGQQVNISLKTQSLISCRPTMGSLFGGTRMEE